MIRNSIVGLVVCLCLLAEANAWAQTYHVPDTGDPNERVCNPRSYTDLGNGIVRDNVTGLEWQKSTAPGTYDFTGAFFYCVSLGSGWSVPALKQLSTLLDSSTSNPSINTAYFSDTVSEEYWSTVFIKPSRITAVWGVDFSEGSFWPIDMTYGGDGRLRAVRGGLPANAFIDNGDGTVSDESTGLMWQQATAPDIYTFENAKAYCSNMGLGGYSDWRLPTINELQSVVKYGTSNNPAIDRTFFPDTGGYYWSSTTHPYHNGSAWIIHFYDGRRLYDAKTNVSLVRAVRGGPCRADGDWCIEDSDCSEGYECVDGSCVPVVVDNPPAITAGPYLAAGYWPLLPTSQESAIMLDANYDVLWKFSDDFGSCSEACTHFAEYQKVGASEWTALPVTANAAKGQAWVTLPVESLQNAATYAFRFAVTDCANQTTPSGTYYFKVVRQDDPPVITGGPYLAACNWPVLSTSNAGSPFVLDQNYAVVWTFSDDFASCTEACTHRAGYQQYDGTEPLVWLPVTVNAARGYAYVTLPVESLPNGIYWFYFDVRDCAGQYASSSDGGEYYFFEVMR